MADPVALLNKLLEENNLTLSLTPMKWRQIEDGAYIVEKPSLVVNFVKEEAHESAKAKARPASRKTN